MPPRQRAVRPQDPQDDADRLPGRRRGQHLERIADHLENLAGPPSRGRPVRIALLARRRMALDHLSAEKERPEPFEPLRPARIPVREVADRPLSQIVEHRIEELEHGLGLELETPDAEPPRRFRHEGLQRSRPALEELALRLHDVRQEGQQRGDLARGLEHHGDQRVVIAQLQVVQQILEHREGQPGVRVQERQKHTPGPPDVVAVRPVQRLGQLAVQRDEKRLERLRIGARRQLLRQQPKALRREGVPRPEDLPERLASVRHRADQPGAAPPRERAGGEPVTRRPARGLPEDGLPDTSNTPRRDGTTHGGCPSIARPTSTLSCMFEPPPPRLQGGNPQVRPRPRSPRSSPLS